MRMRAVWNGAVLAESDDTVVVEGNHYFPPESLNRQYFTTSATHTVCPWKGIASYHTVTVDGVANPDAAWFYPHPTPLARKVKDRVAFWRSVRIEPVAEAADRRFGAMTEQVDVTIVGLGPGGSATRPPIGMTRSRSIASPARAGRFVRGWAAGRTGAGRRRRPDLRRASR